MSATTRRKLQELQDARARMTAQQSPTRNDHLHNLTNDQLVAIIGIHPDDLTNKTDAQLEAIIDGTAEREAMP